MEEKRHKRVQIYSIVFVAYGARAPNITPYFMLLFMYTYRGEYYANDVMLFDVQKNKRTLIFKQQPLQNEFMQTPTQINTMHDTRFTVRMNVAGNLCRDSGARNSVDILNAKANHYFNFVQLMISVVYVIQFVAATCIWKLEKNQHFNLKI